ILTGLLSFMSDDAVTAGSIVASEADRRKLARLSMANNCCSPMFPQAVPPTWWTATRPRLPRQQMQQRGGGMGRAERRGRGQRSRWESGCAAAAAALSAGKAAEAAVTGSGSGSGAKPGISSLSFWVTAAVVLICGCVMAVPFLDSLSSSLLRLS
ncbi:hypothetical protein CLOP_g5578, partial [Closterium sp. NIES-67]